MVISVGVDWLTCTQIPEMADDIVALGQHIINERGKAGWKIKEGGFGGHGYKGQSVEGCGLGFRDSDVILRLSGDLAREHWREAVASARTVSRIDLQVTYRLGECDTSHGLKMWEAFQAYRERVKNGRPPSGSLVQRVPMGHTVYIGSRSSDVFGRHYDKGAEQGTREVRRQRAEGKDMDEPRGREGWEWRAEVEYKRQFARTVARALEKLETDVDSTIAGLVHGFFAGRGMLLPFDAEDVPELRPERIESDADRWLQWVRTSVAPGFRRMVELGRGEEALNAVLAELLTDGVGSLRQVLGLE